MAVVRSQRVDLRTIGVERQREVVPVLNPEVAVEAALEIRGLLFQLLRERWVFPDLAGEAGTPNLRVVGVALELARGPREAG